MNGKLPCRVVFRHPALQDLSRDHFAALNHVVQVRRVAERDRFARAADDVIAAYLAYLRRDLVEHFCEEEELLAVHLPDHHRARMLREHRMLRQGVEGTSLAAAWENAQALQAHVRWEEDEVFPWLQANLTEAELETIRLASLAFRDRHGLPAGPSRSPR